MKNTQGSLSFDAYIGDTDFNRTIQSMNQRIIGLSNTAKSESKKMESSFANMGQLAAGAFATIGLAQLPAQIVKVRGEFQQLEIALNTMLGSKSKADKLMGEIVATAASTPFGLKDLAAGTKQLLAYGSASETVVGEIRMLGDVASGVSVPINELIYLYGTLRSQGRAYAVDIRQFAGRGIPIYAELAKVLKVQVGEVNALVEAGKVGFPQVEQAFKNMTSAGGMFNNLMDAQSKSIPGMIERLKDGIDVAFNEIGKNNQGLIEGVISGASTVVENYQKIIDVLVVVAATYGTYRAALMLTAAVQSSALIISEAQAFFALARSIKTAADAQALFNIATRANPYVLAATAIMALVTAYAVFGDEASQAEKIQRSLADSMKAAEDAAAGEQAKIMVLTSQIKDETKSRENRNKKLQELIQLSPTHLNALTLENIATADGTKAIGDYIEAKKKQIELKEIEAQLEGSIKRQNEARNGQNDLSMWDKIALSASAASGVGDYSKNAASERKRLNGEIAQSEDQLQKKLIERIGIITGVGEAAKKTGAVVAKVSAKTVENYNEEIKALKDKQEKSASSAEYKALDNQIKSLEKARDRITGGKVAKVAEKDKPQPFGSLAYYEQVARKADEIIAKTPGSNVSEITRQNQIKIEAEKKADEIRKLTAVKTFEDELAQKKTSYENYQRWVTAYGESEAKKSFESLTNQGESYAAYLAGQIKKLEDQEKLPGVGLDGVERENLVKLKVEYSDVTGAETPLQKFQKRLDEARSSATSLTDEIEKLKAVQAGLNPNDMSSDGIEMRKQTAEQLIETERQRKQLLQDFLISVAGSEQKRLEITTHYADLRAEVEKKFADKTSASYQKALSAIEKKEKEELSAFEVDAVKASKGYKELERIIALSGRNETKIRLETEKAKLALMKEGTDEYIEQLKRVRAAEEDHRQHVMQTWGQIAGMFDQLGASLEAYGGNIGNIGGTLSGVGSAIKQISTAMANMDSYKTSGGKMSMDGYVAAAQSVIQIVTGIIDAQKRRRDAEKQFAAERIGFENEYQLSLNSSLGDNYKKNPFYKDYEGMIKAGVDQYADAATKYQAALDKLDEGKAKERQKNAVDGKTVGQLAGSGAVLGGIIGSYIPVLGTIVGGAIGAGVGALFGLLAKKKKDVYGSLLGQYPELVKETAEGWAELNVEMAQALITNNQVDDKTKEMIQNAISLSEAMAEAKLQVQDTMVELTGQVGDKLESALRDAFRAGNSEAQALHQTVNDIIADVASKLLFSNLVGPALEQLTKEMTDSLTSGDGAIVDDLTRFEKYGLPAVESYFEGLSEFEEWAKGKGFGDVFGKEQGGDKAKGLTGAIQGMSQENSSILIGQFNALRISGADSANSLRQMLIYQANISRNSDYQKNLTLLVEINAGIKDLNKNPLRASGL